MTRPTKAPFLTSVCDSERHRLCGGWWCICPCHDDVDMGERSEVGEHVEHEWRQVGACVYCSCGPRLYQGEAPASAQEREAMAAIFDAWHAKAVKEWEAARAEVMKARCVEGVRPDQCDHSSTGGRCDVCGLPQINDRRAVAGAGHIGDVPLLASEPNRPKTGR